MQAAVAAEPAAGQQWLLGERDKEEQAARAAEEESLESWLNDMVPLDTTLVPEPLARGFGLATESSQTSFAHGAPGWPGGAMQQLPRGGSGGGNAASYGEQPDVELPPGPGAYLPPALPFDPRDGGAQLAAAAAAAAQGRASPTPGLPGFLDPQQQQQAMTGQQGYPFGLPGTLPFGQPPGQYGGLPGPQFNFPGMQPYGMPPGYQPQGGAGQQQQQQQAGGGGPDGAGPQGAVAAQVLAAQALAQQAQQAEQQYQMQQHSAMQAYAYHQQQQQAAAAHMAAAAAAHQANPYGNPYGPQMPAPYASGWGYQGYPNYYYSQYGGMPYPQQMPGMQPLGGMMGLGGGGQQQPLGLDEGLGAGAEGGPLGAAGAGAAGGEGEEGGEATAVKKARLIWTTVLHRRFTEALDKCGGVDKALPKAIMKEMDVKGLTRENVASHLQKHRMRLKKEEAAAVAGGEEGEEEAGGSSGHGAAVGKAGRGGRGGQRKKAGGRAARGGAAAAGGPPPASAAASIQSDGRTAEEDNGEEASAEGPAAGLAEEGEASNVRPRGAGQADGEPLAKRQQQPAGGAGGGRGEGGD